MALDFSIQTAIVGTLGSSVILSATLFYLWRLDTSQRALYFWFIAFAAQSLRMAAQLGITLGISGLWTIADGLFAVVTLFIWLGTCALAERPARHWILSGMLMLPLAWELFAASQGYGFVARTLPVYALACAVMIQAAINLFRLSRRSPGLGYRGLGVLFALLGLHYLDYPFLRTLPSFAPVGFALAAALMLCMGIAMLIITQRRQQFAVQEVASRLQKEISERQESEYRYQTLVDELDEGIVVVDRAGAVVTANPAAARMLGATLDELRNQTVRRRPYQLSYEDGRPLAESDYPLYRALNQGVSSAPEIYRLERTDGSSAWLSINARPLFRDGSNAPPYAAIVSFSDISDRKAAERSLLASELRFRSIFESMSGIAVQGYDRHRRVLYWNDASRQFYGYEKHEALGHIIDELVIPPAERESFARSIDATVASGRPRPPGEFQAIRKDGSPISVYSSQVLINNLAGDPEIYCIDIDLSDIHRLQKELQESSERFRAITESSELGVAVANPEGVFIYSSPRYQSLAASTEEEVRQGLWIERLHPDDRKPVREAWRKAVATQTGFTIERRVMHDDGETAWVQAHIVPINPGSNDFRGFVATVEDITARKKAEAALRRNEAKFRATFDQAFQFIGLLDTEGVVLDANRTALEFAGIKPADVIGRPFRDSPWWTDADERKKLDRGLIEANNGQLVRFETHHLDSNGKLHYIDFSLKPVFGTDGRVEMLIPEGRDITPLKQAEEALRISEARFSGAFHASLDYITISHIDSGELIDVNEAFERITGWRREEVIGKSTTSLGIWLNQDMRDEAIDLLKRDGYLREHPMSLITRDGVHIDCVLNASLIDAGEDQLLLGVVRDISAQKRAEELLRQSEEKFSRIVHYSPTALIITDAKDGSVIDFNMAWQEMFGFKREDVIGKSTAEFGLWVDEEERNQLYRALRENNEQLDRFECRYRRADGTALYGLASGRSFVVAGRPAYLWSITDITLRHEIEERMAALNTELEERVDARTNELRRTQDDLIRAEKLAALGALVAGVAHELNTPIGNSVTVASTLHEKTVEFSELVAEGTLKRSSLNTYLTAAQTASDLLLRSLNQARNLVSSFKQVAVDQTSDQRRKFDLREVVGEVLTTLSPTIRKTPFSVVIDIPEGIVMDSYPGPLGQIVTNFISNALLHAFDGRLAGTITLRGGLPEHGQLVLTVSDDGNGIPEDHLRRIFDPFFTTKLGKGGSGLGLNIVYNIVTQVLGGKITVESRLGAGTTFMLTMPLCAPGENNERTNPR